VYHLLDRLQPGLGPAALLLPTILVGSGAYQFHSMRRAQLAVRDA
jgi:hypothetical protein